MNKNSGKDQNFMIKLSTFIVDKRNLIFLITIILLIFSLFLRSWVEVENDLTTYLPEKSETKKALSIMEEEFTTYGTAKVMVANITKDGADEIKEELENIKGVMTVSYDNTPTHYNNLSALFDITFDYDESNEECLNSLSKVKDLLSNYDLYISTELGNAKAETIEKEINVIMVLVAVVIVSVLLFTSETYGEIPVLILTFVIGMLINQGSNFMMGKISFVSNSVTSILQLALSIDYAIIFCNRFKDEHKKLPLRESVIVALSKSIPEIGASSLTTIGGLVAMLFMQFKLGPDMALCLIKSIFFALLSCFVVMPGLLMLFGPLIDKTAHKSFVPKIDFIGTFDYKTRHIVPVIFVFIIIFAMLTSNNCPFAYGYSILTTPKLNDTQIAQQMISDTFESENMIALVIPSNNYDKEKKILTELEQYDEIDHTMGLTNIEAMDGYMLADKLTPRQFSELAGIDYELAELVYAAYGAEHSDYGKILTTISSYKVPLIDMLLFVCDQIDSGIVSLGAEQEEKLADAKIQMMSAKKQLQGNNYNRMLIYLTLPESGDETYTFTDRIREIAQGYFPDENVYIAGNSTNEYDFEKSFDIDNTVVSLVSVLIVMVVLLWTFKSAGMPVLLIAVIQGSIWINFAVPALLDKPLFFLSYLIVSSIQMGANIDYAIVIASRYQDVKQHMEKKDAIIDTMNFAFPTIITSGAILMISGFLIGSMTSEAAIAGIGESLGRGTLISIFLVMFILPQILLIGSKLIDKTSFSVRTTIEKKELSGRVFVDGIAAGTINGNFKGLIRGSIDGDVNLNIISGNATESDKDDIGGNEDEK